VHQLVAVRLPERFRGGCAFGSGVGFPSRSLPRESGGGMRDRGVGVKVGGGRRLRQPAAC